MRLVRPYLSSLDCFEALYTLETALAGQRPCFRLSIYNLWNVDTLGTSFCFSQLWEKNVQQLTESVVYIFFSQTLSTTEQKVKSRAILCFLVSPSRVLVMC